MVAVIGPNGAGKTTLLSIVAGVQAASAGTVSAQASEVGWAPQQPAVYSKLSVRENLRLFARLEGVGDVDGAVARMLAQTGLGERAEDLLQRLSAGNRQRVNVAVGLLADPPVLALDEPSTALDPTQRARLFEFIAQIAAGGSAVVFSTHIVEEAQRYADRVLVLDGGHRRFFGAPADACGSQPGCEDFESAFVSFLARGGQPERRAPRRRRESRPYEVAPRQGPAILRRSRLLLAVLLVYPVAISLLIGLAISRSPAKPKVAVVNLTPAGQSIELAGRTLGVQQYANELFSQVDAVKAPTRAAAVAEVSSGKALAAVVIPSDIVSKISSGMSQAQVEVIYNGNALQQSIAKASIGSALAEANLALSKQIRDVAVRDIDILLKGGELGILAAPQDLVGLDHIPGVLHGIAARQGSPADRRELERIANFASFAASNLGLSKNVLATVSQPIAVKDTLLYGKRTPLDSFAIVVAVAISLLFVGVLLASGGLALEQEEHALARLTRGSARRPALVSLEQLIAEKVALAACCAFVLAAAMLCAIAAFVRLDWGRLPLWLIALAAGRSPLARSGWRSVRWRGRCAPRACWRSCFRCRSRCWRSSPQAPSRAASTT